MFKLIGQFVVLRSLIRLGDEYINKASIQKCKKCKSPLYQNKLQEVYRNKHGVVCKGCYYKLDIITHKTK
ncbi:hypothetical protein ABW04_27020 [Priestia megaterium]|nr:hypothetical protein ABW04_27020 [Priestia megaterium]